MMESVSVSVEIKNILIYKRRNEARKHLLSISI